MARLDDIDLDIKNAVLRANATDREEIGRILNYLYRLSAKLKWWQTKLDRGNLTDEERKIYEGLITGAEADAARIREAETAIAALESGKADNRLADEMHNGLLSMVDYPTLQWRMIPQYSNFNGLSAFSMGVYYATANVAATLTGYPTTNHSVMVCFGNEDMRQYQLVIDCTSNPTRAWGRAGGAEGGAFKELAWSASAATHSVAGLMSAADKAKLLGMPGYNMLPGYTGETTGTVLSNGVFTRINVNEIFAGMVGTPVVVSFDVKGNAGDQLKVYAYQMSGLSIDTPQSGTGSITFTLTASWKRVSFNATVKQWANTLNDGSIGFFVSGGTVAYTLRKVKIETGTSATAWTPAMEDYCTDTQVTFNSIRNTGNTTEGTGSLRKIGKTVYLNFCTTIKNALAANTWLSVGMLPAVYIPAEGVTFIACTTATGASFLRGFLWANDGNIGVQTPTAFSAGMQIRGQVTYFVA